jgi:thioredoxin 1
VKKLIGFMALLGLLTLITPAFAADEPSPLPEVPVKGMVTMVDVGADKCIPCRMMAPILREVDEAYKGRVAIVFIDVWKNKGQEKRFGIRTIPTQIFYDKEGNEVKRHEGFLDKIKMIEIFRELGVED